MTIGLLNVYSTRNLGDAAIIASLAQMAPGGSVQAVIEEPDPVPVRGVENVLDLAAARHFVSVGGDIFNNARPAFVTRRFLANLGALLQAPGHTMVFGQSIPRSCRGLSLRLLAAIWRRLASVTVRDVESARLLRRLGVPCELSFDTAFALSPEPGAAAAARALLDASGLEPERTALISIRGFDALYGQDQQRFERTILELADHLEVAGLQPALLLQADVDERDSDRAIASSLMSRRPTLGMIDAMLPITGVSPVGLLIGLLEVAEVVVAVRYHTAVLRLVAGRLPYVLAYSNKGQDLIDRLGLPGAPLSAFDPKSAMDDIVGTASAPFDAGPLRHEVRSAFASNLARIGA